MIKKQVRDVKKIPYFLNVLICETEKKKLYKANLSNGNRKKVQS